MLAAGGYYDSRMGHDGIRGNGVAAKCGSRAFLILGKNKKPNLTRR
jgi:hypothetical protein